MVENLDHESSSWAFWNMNWGTRQAKDEMIVDHALETYPDVEVFAAVETKVDTFVSMFPRRGWKVAQNRSNEAKRNNAVAWKTGSLKNLKVRGLKTGVDPHGVRMLSRKLRILDFDLRNSKCNLRTCRVILGHNAPARFRWLQPLFNASVKFRIKARRWSRAGRWAYVADNNEDGRIVAHRLGGTFHGSGIDGWILGPGMKMTDMTVDSLPKRKGWTDHVGIVLTLRLKD